MASGKIYHVTTTPTKPTGATTSYYPRDVLMEGSTFSPGIGDIVIVDTRPITPSDSHPGNNPTGRYYYSIVG